MILNRTGLYIPAPGLQMSEFMCPIDVQLEPDFNDNYGKFSRTTNYIIYQFNNENTLCKIYSGKFKI